MSELHLDLPTPQGHTTSDTTRLETFLHDSQSAAHHLLDTASSQTSGHTDSLDQRMQAVTTGTADSNSESLLPRLDFSAAGQNTTAGFVRGLTGSAVYALVQSPLEGISQTFDRTIGQTIGSDLYDKTKDLLVTAPKPAQFGTAEWHGQSIGGSLGVIPWFLATRAVLRGAGFAQLTGGLLSSEAEAAVTGKVISAAGASAILESGVTAATYAGAFKPVSPQEGNYWSGKAGQMVSDFATFSTLTAGSIYIGGKLAVVANPLIEAGGRTAQLTRFGSAALTGALSGVPAAAVETAEQYVLSGGKQRPTLADFAKSAYSFAVVGAALSSDQLLSRTKSAATSGDAKAHNTQSDTGKSSGIPAFGTKSGTTPGGGDALNAPTDKTTNTVGSEHLLKAAAMPLAQSQSEWISGMMHESSWGSWKEPEFKGHPLNNFGSKPYFNNAESADSPYHVDIPFNSKMFMAATGGVPEFSDAHLPFSAQNDNNILKPFAEGPVNPVPERHEIVSVQMLAQALESLPTAAESQNLLYQRQIGDIPQALRPEGISQEMAFGHIDALARALRSLDAGLPPQKKDGLGTGDLRLAPFTFAIGGEQVTVSKVGIGEVAHVYKLSKGGQDYALKIPNDPSRMDVHGAYAETGAFVYLSKHQVSDLIDFHAANLHPKSGWMLTEFVSQPVARQGTPLKEVLAEQGLRLGDDWYANRGPGNVVWDLGGIEPKGVAKPTNLEQLDKLLWSRDGDFVAGRRLEAIKDPQELKKALLRCLDFHSVGGQVARSAVRLLKDPAALNEVMSKAFQTPGAAGRAAFELDYMQGTPYITSLYYKALNNPESRVEAVKQIDKLPPQERKAAFDAAMVFPEARAMAARSIPAIEDAAERAQATEQARNFPGSNFVLLEMTGRQRPLTENENAEKQRSFEQYLDSFGLATGAKLHAESPEASFQHWLEKNPQPQVTGEKAGAGADYGQRIGRIWPHLNDSQKELSSPALRQLSDDWIYLEPQQWRSLSARDTLETEQMLRSFRLTPTESREFFEKPDLVHWLATHAGEEPVDLYNKTELFQSWNQFPSNLKTLTPAELDLVSGAFSRMEASDWEKVPADSATAVANTLTSLHLYKNEASYLVESPDFVNWFQETCQLNPFNRDDYLRLLKAWSQLSPEQKQASPEELSRIAEHLENEETIKFYFGADSAVLPYLTALETGKGSALTNVVRWVHGLRNTQTSSEDLPQACAVVERLVAANAPAEAFSSKNLSNQVFLEKYFADDPALRASLERQLPDEDKLYRACKFVSSNPQVNAIVLQQALVHKITGREEDWSNMIEASNLARALDLDAAGIGHLYDLQSVGLQLRQLNRYLRENSTSSPRIKSLVESKAGMDELSVKTLVDRDSLARMHDFSEAERAQLETLQKQGLSLDRMRNHLKDRPNDALYFHTLLNDGASAREINDFMRLSVMPPVVALEIASAVQKGTITTEAVVANLRDWQSGRYFRELLIEHVKHGATLSRQELDKMHVAAGKMAEAHTPLAKVDSDIDSGKQNSHAQSFKDALAGIERQIPAGKPVALLGRDAWPLVPLLRASGRDAYYFMWSRLQNNDTVTQRQWLREIPPGAAVIDSGFSGSIIDVIKTIDPSVSGYLMSSSNKTVYPQLMTLDDAHTRVSALEDLPKLIYRSHAHNDHGNALSRKIPAHQDGDVANTIYKASRWYAERQSREMLRAAGLGPWDVWRYSQFVGLTPRERLGRNSPDQVEAHYRSVLEARAQASAQAQAANFEAKVAAAQGAAPALSSPSKTGNSGSAPGSEASDYSINIPTAGTAHPQPANSTLWSSALAKAALANKIIGYFKPQPAQGSMTTVQNAENAADTQGKILHQKYFVAEQDNSRQIGQSLQTQH